MPSLQMRNNEDAQSEDDRESVADGEQRGDAKREQSKRHKLGGFCCHHDGLQTTNKLCTHKC